MNELFTLGLDKIQSKPYSPTMTKKQLMKELNEALSVGPILMGLSEPIHVLQLGASVEEIVNMSAIAVIDAQSKKV